MATVLAMRSRRRIASGLLFGLAPAARLLRSPAEARGQSLNSRCVRPGDRGGAGVRRVCVRCCSSASSRSRSCCLSAPVCLLRSAYRLGDDRLRIPAGRSRDGIVRPAARSIRRDRSPRRVLRSAASTTCVELPDVTGVAGTTEELGSASSMTFSFAIEGRPSRNASGREDPSRCASLPATTSASWAFRCDAVARSRQPIARTLGAGRDRQRVARATALAGRRPGGTRDQLRRRHRAVARDRRRRR